VGRLKWYKRDPNKALVGMRRLTLEECGAYNLILDLIYAHDGQLADDDQFLTGWIGGDIRIWRRLKARLIELQKIEVKDGFITNSRATEEVESGLARIQKASRAGKISAEIRRTYAGSSADVAPHSNRSYSIKSEAFISKNNKLIPTKDELAFQLSTTTTTKKDTPVRASSDALPNPEKELFRRGKEVLQDAKAGGFIAKLLAATGRDAVEALGIIEMAAESENPREYIGAAIKGAKNGNGTYRRAGKSNGHDFFARMAGVQNDPAGRIKPSPEPSRGPTIDLPAKEVGRGPSDGFGGLLGLPNAK